MTASDFAALPQHDPSAAAAAEVPQHGSELAATVAAFVDTAVLPQQPPVLVTASAAAGSPVKPPGVFSVMAVSLRLT